MKTSKSILIVISSLAIWATASASFADGTLNTQYRYEKHHNTKPYYHNPSPVIYPRQHYYPQGNTVIIVQPRRRHSGNDIYQRNLKRNRIANSRIHSRQNQCLGSHCGEKTE